MSYVTTTESAWSILCAQVPLEFAMLHCGRLQVGPMRAFVNASVLALPHTNSFLEQRPCHEPKRPLALDTVSHNTATAPCTGPPTTTCQIVIRQGVKAWLFFRTIVTLSTPSTSQVRKGAGHLHGLQGPQHLVENAVLQCDRQWLTKGMAKRPAEKQGPWRANLNREVSDQAN
jgi:hypothetical protein